MVAPERRRSRRVDAGAPDPIQVELRCGEGRPALTLAARDIAIHGLGVEIDPEVLAELDEQRGLDVEFVLPGQLDRIGVPVVVRHQREEGESLLLGLEFAFEDAVQKDWATARVAEYVAGRLTGRETLGRAA